MSIYQIWKIYQHHVHLHVPHVPTQVYQQPPKNFVQSKNELHWMKQLEEQMRWKAVKPWPMAGAWHCEGIWGTQEIMGKMFNGTVFLGVCCRSFENYGIVVFVGFQDDIILWWNIFTMLKIFSSRNVLDEQINQQGRLARNISWAMWILIVKVPTVLATPSTGGIWPSIWGL